MNFAPAQYYYHQFRDNSGAELRKIDCSAFAVASNVLMRGTQVFAFDRGTQIYALAYQGINNTEGEFTSRTCLWPWPCPCDVC